LEREFTSGTLAQQGFEIPQSTHSEKMEKFFGKLIIFVV
jgi:hypothetical protein